MAQAERGRENMTTHAGGQGGAASVAEFGVIGLGNMGENLALNIADRGYRVALWNHRPEKVNRFLNNHGAEGLWVGTKTLRQFVTALLRPRQILLTVPAGKPVDDTIRKLLPLLSSDDIVIDGGNSLFTDTERRERALSARGIRLVGMGISGGTEGARVGPSLMPGGARSAYEVTRPILEAIAAKTDSGPCVTYVGPGGAGHFVKMVHNGIEYGNMQAIAEAYDILRKAFELSAMDVSTLFSEWNQGPQQSYLIEITSLVLAARDPETGQPLINMILDHAEQKGTGRWTAQAALELGIPIPTIAAAVDARVLSSMKAERVRASRELAHSAVRCVVDDKDMLIDAVQAALSASTVCSYAQGMALLRAASDTYEWDVDLSEIARIWKGGCIIRARLLDTIMQAFKRNASLPNLLVDPAISPRLLETERGWRLTLQTAVDLGIPAPAMSASLAYFDTYRTAALPQNLTEAQRDFFGAHRYRRIDRPDAEPVHTDWRTLIDRQAAAVGD